jgi:O-antigen/teichoic acid export membrane protein
VPRGVVAGFESLKEAASEHRWRLRQAAITVVEQGSYSVANFTISLLLARWLTPREYGSYVLAFAALMFIGGFQNALVLEPFSVFGAVRYRTGFRRYLSVLAGYQTGIALVIGLAFVAAAALVPSLLPADLVDDTHGLMIAMPAVFLASLVRRAFYITGTPRGALVSTLVQAACSLLGLAAMVRFAQLSGVSALLVVGSGALCGAVVGWVRLTANEPTKTTEPFDARRVLDDHWRFGGWLALTNIAYWAAGQGFIIVIAARLDVAEVGAYNAMLNFVTPVAVMMNALGVLILPWMVSRYTRLGPASLHYSMVRVSVLLGAATLLSLLPLLAFGAFLTDTVYGGRYTAYHWILGYLVVARVIACVSLAIGMGLRAVEASRAVFFANVATAVFTLVFAMPAAALWGLRGITLGIVLGEVVLASALWIQWRRHLSDAPLHPQNAVVETVVD